MDCHEIKGRLSEYADGMLPEAEASMIKEHLAHCADCLDTYESMSRIMGHMSQMEIVDAPADFLEKVNARLDRRFSWGEFARRLFVPPRIKLPLQAAGVAAAVVLVVYFVAIRDTQGLYEITVSMDKGRVSDMVVPEKRGEKRGEPRRGDKKGGEKGPAEKTSLEDVIGSLGGKMISTEYREGTDIPASILVELPADNYETFLDGLAGIGIIQESSARPPEKDKDLIKVKIVIQHGDG